MCFSPWQCKQTLTTSSSSCCKHFPDKLWIFHLLDDLISGVEHVPEILTRGWMNSQTKPLLLFHFLKNTVWFWEVKTWWNLCLSIKNNGPRSHCEICPPRMRFNALERWGCYWFHSDVPSTMTERATACMQYLPHVQDWTVHQVTHNEAHMMWSTHHQLVFGPEADIYEEEGSTL